MSSGVTRRPNGKWIARFRGPDRRERSKTFDTKRDAQAWRGQQIASMRSGNWIDPTSSRHQLSEIATRWIQNKRLANLRPSSIASYEEILRNRVLPKWGQYSLSAITVDEINRWVAELSAENLSASRISHCVRVLAQILSLAVSNRQLGFNVAENKNITRPRLPRPAPRAFTAQEVRRLVEEMPGHFKLLTEFLCFTGLRMSEVVALRVPDIDLEKQTLSVERSTVLVEGEYFDGPPKSGRSREVPLIDELTEKLRIHLRGRGEKDWVFPGTDGGQLKHDEFRGVFNRRVERIGRPEMTPHTCRDTFASLAVSAGVPITLISQSLGHADPSITLRIYSTFYRSDFGRMRELLGQAVQVPR